MYKNYEISNLSSIILLTYLVISVPKFSLIKLSNEV